MRNRGDIRARSQTKVALLAMVRAWQTRTSVPPVRSARNLSPTTRLRMPRQSPVVFVATSLACLTYTARSFLMPSARYAMVMGSGCGFLPWP